MLFGWCGKASRKRVDTAPAGWVRQRSSSAFVKNSKNKLPTPILRAIATVCSTIRKNKNPAPLGAGFL